MLDQDFKLASIIHKGFTQHKELNPQIFDEEQRIRPEVREKLILAANDFIDTLNIDNIDFEDIVIVGSIVNYNWNPYSDVDLHIIFDFKEIDENIELVSEFFMAKKSLWNQDHDVKIYEYDVELYGQDINEENASGGIYSLMKNEWVKKPEPEQYEVSESSLIKKTKYFIKLLNDVLELDATDETKIKKLKAIKEKIRKYRKSGLETGGEYSEENLTFKMLRRSGYLEKLSDIKNDLEDKMMSLSEGLMLPYKKIKYYDLNTGEEFPKSEINEHPQWYKREYNTNGNIIYVKWNDGVWSKSEYDNNERQTYFENSDGYWEKREYDINGNEIYYEASNGNIIDNRNNIQEGLMLQYKKFPDRYFDDRTGKEFPKSEINEHPRWYKREFDANGNVIYWERDDGVWSKSEYDNNERQTYYENSDGYWYKYEYDENGNVIYYENSRGYIDDNRNSIQEGLTLPKKKHQPKYFDYYTDKEFPRSEINEHPLWYKEEYDADGNLIYYENSDGFWKKREYDENGNVIYIENSYGYWVKYEYDEDGNRIYWEDSNGFIKDYRNQIQEGLMLPYKDLSTPELWLKDLLTPMDTYYLQKYPNSIFFIFNDEIYMRYYKDTKNLYYHYYKIHSVLASKFELNEKQVKNLVKNIVEEHYHLEVNKTQACCTIWRKCNWEKILLER